MRVISPQQQINRLLLVIHHRNIHELASLRFLNLNLEWQNIKKGRKTYEDLFFFLSFFSLINHHHAVGYTVVSIDAVVLIAAATIIAIRGQKNIRLTFK